MFSKANSIVLAILIFVSTLLIGQSNQTQLTPDAYANFLYNAELYDYAIDEYEKLHFYHPNNLDYLKRLIQSYKKAGKNDLVKDRLNILDFNNKSLLLEYYDLLLATGNTSRLEEFYSQQKSLFDQNEQADLEFKIAVGNGSWEKAKTIYNKYDFLEPYEPIVQKIESSKYKKIGTAVALSSLVPGLGRVYAKDYKDGAISLLFVATSAFQSYRRFKKDGIESVGGWIYGSISLGFYISNIYGTIQSTKSYNKKIDERISSFSLPIILDSTK